MFVLFHGSFSVCCFSDSASSVSGDCEVKTTWTNIGDGCIISYRDGCSVERFFFSMFLTFDQKCISLERHSFKLSLMKELANVTSELLLLETHHVAAAYRTARFCSLPASPCNVLKVAWCNSVFEIVERN